MNVPGVKVKVPKMCFSSDDGGEPTEIETALVAFYHSASTLILRRSFLSTSN